jgi:signal transduction histidine kinase
MLLAFCSQSSEAVPSYPILNVLEAGSLMLFLAIPQLRRWLGRLYLPIALGIATVGPMLARTMIIWARLSHGYSAELAYVDPGLLFFVLFIPLSLLSTQYGLKTLLVYCFGSAILQILLAIPAAKVGGPALKLTSDQVIITTIIYVLVGYVIVRLMSAQRAQRRELAQTNVKLTEYANTLEQLAVSRERNRMARELHDTLAHTLSAVAIQLEALDALWDGDPQAARKTLLLSRDLTRSGLLETRRALQALRANPLEDLGLVLAMRHLAETTATRAGLQLSLDMSHKLGQLPPFAEQSVYRIAEEALNNTVRHANARHLTVSLKRNPKQVMLLIADDGLGFDTAQPTQDGHFGLLGMRERAALCNALLRIESAPGKGTSICLTLEENL